MKKFYGALSCLLFLFSSCAFYTKTNSKDYREDKKTYMPLEMDEYKDISNGCRSFSAAGSFFPMTMYRTMFSSYITRHYPISIHLRYADIKVGEMDVYTDWLLDDIFTGFNYNVKEKFLIPQNFTIQYTYPIWHSVRKFEKFRMDIGYLNRTYYYGKLPTKYRLELSARGSLQQRFSRFLFEDKFLKSILTEKIDNFYHGPDELFLTQSSQTLNFGFIFQRKIATQFKTNIKGVDFTSVYIQTKGFYFDFSFLVNSKERLTPIRYVIKNEVEPDVVTLTDVNTDIRPSDILAKKVFGFNFGYKYHSQKTHKLAGSHTRIFEIGTSPGFIDNRWYGLYFKFSLCFGLGFNR